MNILISGANGFVGSSLVPGLEKTGHHVIPLLRGKLGQAGASWRPDEEKINLGSAGPIHAVIHLAGANVARRWTKRVKDEVYRSRVEGTKLLCDAIARLPMKPKVLLCASATGYYGNRGDEILDESSWPGHGFLPDVCKNWEAATHSAVAAGIRVVNMRFGIVLGRGGGALGRMVPLCRLGIGGPLGDGHYHWSWIAMDDVTGAVEHALGNEQLHGPVNFVSPNPVRNREFTKALARVLKRPAFFRVQPFALKVLFGQMAEEALLCSFRVLPKRLEESGYKFKFPELEGALKDIVDSA
jgi:hypothetical protein